MPWVFGSILHPSGWTWPYLFVSGLVTMGLGIIMGHITSQDERLACEEHIQENREIALELTCLKFNALIAGLLYHHILAHTCPMIDADFHILEWCRNRRMFPGTVIQVLSSCSWNAGLSACVGLGQGKRNALGIATASARAASTFPRLLYIVLGRRRVLTVLWLGTWNSC